MLVLEQSAAGSLPHSRLTGTLDGIVEVLPHVAHARVAHIEGHGQFHASLTAVRKHIRTSSSHRTLIGAVNDPSAIGAVRAFEEAGRGDECAAVSQNASEEARDEMRRPDTRLIGSVAYFPENYGPGDHLARARHPAAQAGAAGRVHPASPDHARERQSRVCQRQPDRAGLTPGSCRAATLEGSTHGRDAV